MSRLEALGKLDAEPGGTAGNNVYEGNALASDPYVENSLPSMSELCAHEYPFERFGSHVHVELRLHCQLLDRGRAHNPKSVPAVVGSDLRNIFLLSRVPDGKDRSQGLL